MGNRIKIRNQEPRAKNQVRYQCVFILLGSWFLALGSLSAQGAERIVSLNACTDELLLQFAEPSQIAGVTHFSHSPESEKILSAHPQILKLSGDVEEVYKIKPSVVLAEPFSSQLLLEQLRKAKIPISMIDVPRNWDDLKKVAAHVAEITGHSEKLEALHEKISEVVRLGRNSKWKGKSAVFWSAAGHVSGTGTFEDTVLSTLGMHNRAMFEGYQFLSLEKLIELQPDVIVVTQNPQQKDSWSHETLFHPAIRLALPELKYVVLPETSISCASEYTIESLKNILSKKNE